MNDACVNCNWRCNPIVLCVVCVCVYLRESDSISISLIAIAYAEFLRVNSFCFISAIYSDFLTFKI